MIWFRYWPIVAVLLGMYVFESGWAAILIYHVGLVAGIWQKREAIKELRWKSPAPATWALMAGGLVAGPLVYWGLPWFTSPEIGAELSGRLAVLGLTGGSLFAFFCYFITIHPFLEETGWRGVLLVRSRRLHSNDFEFAAYHLLVLHWFFPGNWFLLMIALVTLTASAWIWRQLRDLLGMSAIIASHLAADFAVMVAAARLADVSLFR